MENPLRKEADGYRRAAQGGLSRPEKFNPVSLFHLVALANECYWIAWLEDHGGAPNHHAFRDLVRAAEKVTTVPAELKREVLVLDQFQKLCEWIPIEPRQPVLDDIPGLLELTDRVAAFTATAACDTKVAEPKEIAV